MLGHTGHPAREVTAPVPSPPPHDVDVFGHWAARSLAEKLQRIDRPVVAMAAEFAEGNIGTHHDHPRGQIEYALTGVMTAITDDGTWVVPPRTALWIPPAPCIRCATGARCHCAPCIWIWPCARPCRPAAGCSGCRTCCMR
ncbi:hypothetical protein ACFQ4K_29165 [Tistrella bauzanensis]